VRDVTLGLSFRVSLSAWPWACALLFEDSISAFKIFDAGSDIISDIIEVVVGIKF
jgi:hypothetical protein